MTSASHNPHDRTPSGSPLRRPRVLHVVPLPPPLGGMSTYAQGLLASDLGKAFNLRAVRAQRVRKDLYRGMIRKGMNLLNGFLLSLVVLKNLVFRWPSIIHVQTNSGRGFYEKSFLIVLARLFGCKAVLHVHGGAFREFYQNSSRPIRWLIRRCACLNHRIIVASQHMQETLTLVGVRPERIVRIGNAIVVPPRSRWEAPAARNTKGVSVLFLNRLTREKGVLELLQAVKQLASATPAVSLRLAGAESEDCASIRQSIEDMGLADRVAWLGQVSEQQKDEEYRRADIYVLASHTEDMPYGLLEAMSYGLPCVASAVGGIPSIIQDGIGGLLVPPKDAASLAGAIAQLASQEELRRRIGLQARARVLQEFSWPHHAKQIGEVYNDLLA